MSTGIDARVKTELERRRGDWRAISDRAGVSHSWLSKFVNGKIDNPGLATLRHVEDALKTTRKEARA